MPIDPTTKREVGDYGTALQAVTFAADHQLCEDAELFLRNWIEGRLDEWPEYYEWLAKQDV